MELNAIKQKIYEIREQRVMLDFDLAELYDVLTKALKQAVRRNMERFPEDFMFELTWEEYRSLRSQFVTLENGRGKYSKYIPFAFTEHGVSMLSGILNSERAIRINIAIFRTFVALRHYAFTYTELSQKIAELEARFEREFSDIQEEHYYPPGHTTQFPAFPKLFHNVNSNPPGTRSGKRVVFAS